VPKFELRMLDHWDNPNGSIERGYAGRSLWKWSQLPDTIDPRYVDYARANASLGINAVALTNVNANIIFLTPDYLKKAAALADVFRPYGIRVFLTARFSSPVELGKLQTADPLDPTVQAWWKQKADEVYALIPDFGGFLMKANSEGQPGPRDYNRSHAEGANLIADALAPHGGIVIWRAFVYAVGAAIDRVKQAWDEFTPLDGQFRPNVFIQVVALLPAARALPAVRRHARRHQRSCRSPKYRAVPHAGSWAVRVCCLTHAQGPAPRGEDAGRHADQLSAHGDGGRGQYRR
jgi:alpha-glucuronidase